MHHMKSNQRKKVESWMKSEVENLCDDSSSYKHVGACEHQIVG